MQSFAQSLFNRQNNRPMTQQVNNNSTIQNAQAPYRQGFPMTPSDFYKKFGAPMSPDKGGFIEHNRLVDNNGKPLIGLHWNKTIVTGLDSDVFASKALMDAGFTYDNFVNALVDGDNTLQIVSHEGSNDIYIAPTKSRPVSQEKLSTCMAAFSKFNTETTEETF